MRRPFLFFACFAAGLTGSLQARAADIEAQNVSIEDVILEAEAAAFFEHTLRISQARRIEAATAAHYQALGAEGRAGFRAARRAKWQAMSDEERSALRGSKQPSYANLTDEQKLPFRRNAALAISGVRLQPARKGRSEV